MKNNFLYITLILALCFGIKAQGQSSQVKTIEEKINSLTPREAQRFDEMISGQTSFIFVSNDSNVFFIEREGTEQKVILLEKISAETNLKNSPFKSSIVSSEILLLDIRNEKDYTEIVNIDFKAYSSLKTIVIITYNDIDLKELQNLVLPVQELGKIEILVKKIETEI
ncbi:hypothetical protein [Myroides injenensis]|uniref:hypothetical protein n=1 Tax=Myroides injenensis TaxID=1183151 RepID=UPI00226D5A17|nr:hypothetical protein [Myroides injenensis]